MININLFKLIFFCLLVLAFECLQPVTSFALNPTSTPSVQISSPSAEIKEKLQVLKDEIASKASQLKAEVSRKLQNKAYVGFVKLKSDDSITLALKEGTKIINVTTFTLYTIPTIKKASLKNLEADDYIAALGDVDDNGILTAKKIVLTAPPQEEEKQILFGTIISKEGQVINIKTPQGQNISLNTNSKTVYQKGAVTTGQTVIAVGRGLKNNLLPTRFIYLLQVNPQVNSTTTPEATKTATSSSKKAL